MEPIIIDYRYVLSKLRPNDEYEWLGGDLHNYSNIGEWLSNSTKPTKQECDDYWNSVLYPQLYNERILALREQAYPPVVDQLDMIYWDRVNNTTKWVDMITNIKTTYKKI